MVCGHVRFSKASLESCVSDLCGKRKSDLRKAIRCNSGCVAVADATFRSDACVTSQFA